LCFSSLVRRDPTIRFLAADCFAEYEDFWVFCGSRNSLREEMLLAKNYFN